jgi:hypothetical protein
MKTENGRPDRSARRGRAAFALALLLAAARWAFSAEEERVGGPGAEDTGGPPWYRPVPFDGAVPPPSAAEPAPQTGPATWPGETTAAPQRAWLRDRLTLGVRHTSFSLKTTRQETYDEARSSYFLGSINELREDDDGFAPRPFLQFWPWRGLGVELTWDRVGARTVTAGDGHSDGTFVASGPMLGLAARWPNTTRLTPYGGAGWCFFDASFDADAWWELSYPDEATWVALGRPAECRNERRRTIQTGDGDGSFWYVGGIIRLYERWNLDVQYRRVSLDTKATFTVRQGDTEVTEPLRGTIPLDHSAWSVGVSYTF